MSVVKELSGTWSVSTYDYIGSSPVIIENAFKKAGIISGIENGVKGPGPVISVTSQESDNDPFDSEGDTDIDHLNFVSCLMICVCFNRLSGSKFAQPKIA